MRKPLRPVMIALVTAYLGYVAVLGTTLRNGFPGKEPAAVGGGYLINNSVTEDGYYMLTVAWNIASGNGITYNRGKATTGIQPLATFIWACLAGLTRFFGGTKWDYVRVVFLFGCMNLLLFGHLVGRIAQSLHVGYPDTDAYVLAFAVSIFNFWMFRCFTNGLETGIYLTLLSAAIWYTSVVATEPVSLPSAAGVGVLSGFAILARIDFAIVLAAFLFIAVVRKTLKPSTGAVVGLAAALVAGPWFLWVHGVSGTWMPSSGLAETELFSFPETLPRLAQVAKSILGYLNPWLDIPFIESNSMKVIAGFVSIAMTWTLVAPGISGDVRPKSANAPMLWAWSAALAVLVPVYFIFFGAIWFYERYLLPLSIPLLVLLALALARRIRLWPDRFALAPLVCVVGAFAVAVCMGLKAGTLARPELYNAEFVADNFRNGAVGMFESGTAGYFNSNVVNLDGKMDADAYRHLQKGDLGDYLDQQHIDVLVASEAWLTGSLGGPYRALHWRFSATQPDDENICLVRTSVGVDGKGR